MHSVIQAITPSAIGLMGGTFNPIHYGHLRIAQALADALHLDEVRFIPAATPPHKPYTEISANHRAAMVKLGISNNSLFKLDTRELHRLGASYTIDTLLSLRDELGQEVSLILLMGSDAFAKLNTWHRWQDIIQLCHIALVQRPISALDKAPLAQVLETFLHNHYTENSAELLESPAGWITMQAVTPVDISSTMIRDTMQNKHSARYLMPDSVIDYIQTQQLYT